MLNVSEERKNYIQKVIVLAQNRREEEVPKNEERSQIIDKVSLLWEDPEKYRESRKSHFEIVDFMSLDLEDVKFLRTVMYMGRDNPNDDDPAALYENIYDTLQWKTKEIEVYSIVGKAPLDEYLEKGLSLLKKIK